LSNRIALWVFDRAAGLRAHIVTDENWIAQSLEFGYSSDSQGSFALATPFQVSKDLLAVDSPGSWRLCSLPEIRRQVAQAASGTLQDIEVRWSRLVQRISTASIALSANGTFLKAKVFPADVAHFVGRASFNLGVCLAFEHDKGQAAAAFKGVVEVCANFSCKVGAVQTDVGLCCQVYIDAGATSPLFSMSLPTMGIAMPLCAMPAFVWPANLNVDLPSFGFSLPALPGIPVVVTHGAATLVFQYDAATGELDVNAQVPAVAVSVFGNPASLGDITFHLYGGKLDISPFTLVPKPVNWDAREPKPLPSPMEGVALGIGAGNLTLALDINSGGKMGWKGYVQTTVSVHPVTQPKKVIEVTFTLPFDADGFQPSVDIAGPVNRNFELVRPTAADLADALIKSLPSVNGLAIRLRMPKASLPDADGLADVLVAILTAVGRGVAGLAGIVLDILQTLLRLLRNAAQALGDLEVLLVLDNKTARLQQLVISLRHADTSKPLSFEAGGFEMVVPATADLALLIDLRDGALDAYAVITTKDEQLLKLGTDLWFSGPALEQPAGEIKKSSAAPAKSEKLIRVEAKPKNGERLSLVPVGVRNGQATFLHALVTPLPVIGGAALEFEGYRLVAIEEQVEVFARFDKQIKDKLLPFLASPGKSDSGAGAFDGLRQYIEITDFAQTEIKLADEGKFEADMGVVLHLMGTDITSQLKLQLDARKLTAGLTGGLIRISLPKSDKPFNILGMEVSFTRKSDGTPVVNDQFFLDMRTRDTRMYLADDIDATLKFTQLGVDTSGRPLTFRIGKFVVHGGGLDLDAALANPYRLKLNGLETDFTFKTASVKISNGKAESFCLEAKGKLPPALMGDVDVGLRLDFGEKADGRVGLLDGMLELDAKGKAIRCENTHFDLTLEHLGVRVFEDGGSLHFCAFLTGSAVFNPAVAELADGMLGKLAGVELRFTDCPLSGASEVVRRELEKLNLSFVVTLDEPMRANLFELFKFEVRAIGFEPRCNQFEDRPAAIVIGGQVSFADTGDVVRAECDFHRLYIAPGQGTLVPRLRCEGLGLALRLGSAFEVEGKVVAVDGRMPPNVLVSPRPDFSLKANGFMGQGRVAIKGLPPFAASFGFVEIMKDGWSSPKRAWFVYLEAQRLSYHFQLGPIPFYLREAGLGLGYHFTYVGIKAIDEAKDLPSVIKQLDHIATNALEPAKLETWDISADDGLTLVARVMFSMSSASSPVETLVWKDEQEAQLPNLLLLNAVLAMRNTTFMMTASAWLGYSYYDWEKGRQIGPNKLTGKQAMTGYIVLAGARSEFLARLVSNPGAEIGPRLALPDAVKDGLRDFQYESTLYMRPGLLHFELGWPNRIRWSKNIGGAQLSVIGGAIFRVHDGALLAGLNLEGVLTFDMSGRLDAGVVGVAVQASIYTAIAARIIGYLDSQSAANSLYYSLFSLQVRVQLSISAWLEIKAWMCKITIRLSFAMTLQIDVLAELAVQGDASVGARMRATISISVFGRSLGLSVGLGMNPGLVDRSAARVARFMTLGLIQDTPSAVAPVGKQDEANEEAARIDDQRRQAREAAAAANASDSSLAKVPQEEAVPAGFGKAPSKKGIDIAATDFQIVLSYPKVMPELDVPLAGELSGWVYLSFLPIESAGKASFYAAPRLPDSTPQCDHQVVFEHIPAALDLLDFYAFVQGKWIKMSVAALRAPLPTHVGWDVELTYTQSTEGTRDQVEPSPQDDDGKAKMQDLFFAAFRTNDTSAGEVKSPYEEPVPKPPLSAKWADSQALSTQAQYNRQERDYLSVLQQGPEDRRCHEARDFLLQKFASDLFEMADTGSVPKGVHIAHLGLTLLVPHELALALASAKDGMVARVGKRVDRKDLPETYEESQDCEIFNPPDLRFAVKRHRFVDPRAVIENNVAKLSWLLEWAGDTAARPAEQMVKHYRVERTILANGAPFKSPAVTVALAYKEEWNKDADGTSYRVQRMSPYRYTDEFDDLPPYLRELVLEATSDIWVRYSVTPVCVSDTDGVVCSNFIARRAAVDRLPRLKEASATLTIDPNAETEMQAVSLQLKLEATEAAVLVNSKKREFCWRILARSEAILPAGDYGADAQTQQSLASKIGAGLAHLPGDLVFDIPAVDTTVYPVDDGKPAKIPGALLALQELIEGVDDPRAWTLLVQTVTRDRDTKAVVASSPPVMAKLAIHIKSFKTDKREDAKPDLITQVPSLEFVRRPYKAELQVLRPVAGDDLFVLPGRAALPEPALEPISRDFRNSLNLHPEFGAVSKLSWNLRPHGQTGGAARKFRLISGFDIYALSLDTGLDPCQEESWIAARRLTAVRLLGADRVNLMPEEIGEPSNWKMRYPSHVARREAAGAWYSDAESYILWPRMPLRVHPLLEPASELIKSLLSQGKPYHIELQMVRQESAKEGDTAVAWRFSLPDGVSGWKLEGHVLKGDTAAGLRAALRELQVHPVQQDAASWDLTARSRWSLVMTSRWVNEDGLQAALSRIETVPMFFERDMHPLIEAILARMRRFTKPGKAPGSRLEALLDLDRRPAPVLKAKTFGEFLASTDEAADPYGWAALDRMGLGVTVRLFDNYDNCFLAPDQLRERLADAVQACSGLYPDAQEHLFVEYLMKPGAMTQRVDFPQQPDEYGRYPFGEQDSPLQEAALAMVRISLRPLIRPHLNYRVFEASAQTASNEPTPGVDVILTRSSEQRSLEKQSLRALLEQAGAKSSQIVISRGEKLPLDESADLHPGADGRSGMPDAFGRFEPWPGWLINGELGAPVAVSWENFWLALRNAMHLDSQAETPDNLKMLKKQWLRWNRRFYDCAAIPSANPFATPQTPYAFGAVEQTEPVQAAADAIGQISTMLPEADGYAHRRAFAVLPRWRYDMLLESCGYGKAQELSTQARADIAKPHDSQRPRHELSAIERTAPVAPQAAFALGRIGDLSWWRQDENYQPAVTAQDEREMAANGFVRAGSSNGDSLAFMLPHHAEQLLGEGNVTVAGNLSRSGLRSTFVLTAIDASWSGEYADDHVLPPVRPGAGVPAVIEDAYEKGMTGLLGQRAGSGQSNAQSRARMVRFLPHWYRHSVVVTAGAGTSAAKATATYLPQAPSTLVHIVKGKASLEPGHPWEKLFKRIDPMEVDGGGDAQSARFLLKLPAIRWRDTADETTRALWPDPISMMPDPEVAYDLEFESGSTSLRPQTVVKPIARIARSADALPGQPQFKVFTFSQEWDVRCEFAAGVSPGFEHELLISIAPLSVAVELTDGLKAALTEDELSRIHLSSGRLRVPGGWSDDWLARFAAALRTRPGKQLELARDLWKGLAKAGAGLPDEGIKAFDAFPRYELQNFRMRRPGTPEAAKELAEGLQAWLDQLAGSGVSLMAALGDVHKDWLAPVLQGKWPYADEHTEVVPWIAGMLEPPGEAVALERTAGSLPRHLVPELMSAGEYAIAHANADKSEMPMLAQLWLTQKSRAFDAGKLAVRATRGDVIALALPLADHA
jgi:hypothetical protein